jgi:hypothetical protein
MRYRLAAILAAVMLLGCNEVYSEHPWFTAADEAGAPRLRDGLWAVLESPDCQFDQSQPPEKWPKCAEAMVVEGGRLLSMDWTTDSAGQRKLDSMDLAEILLAAGNPRILQFRSLGKEGDPADKADKLYLYLGIRPSAQDAEGRITAFTRWLVQCGPLPPAAGASDITKRPFRGLTVSGSECTASSVQTLRSAAVRSESLPGRSGHPETPPARWIREGSS